VALEMKTVCEKCGTALAADAGGAFICSYECTFCAACAEGTLAGRCPNCGGELVPRPIRPAERLAKHPASTARKVKPEGCVANIVSVNCSIRARCLRRPAADLSGKRGETG
jgi:hypothetical protein